MRKLGLAVASLILSTSISLAQESALPNGKGFTVPLTQGAFHVTAFIGGHVPGGKILKGSAVIDTGANVVTVCEEALALAKITPQSVAHVRMQDATGRNSPARQVVLAFVHIGNIKVENVLAVAVPGPCRVPILVGMTWLSRIESATISGHTLTLR